VPSGRSSSATHCATTSAENRVTTTGEPMPHVRLKDLPDSGAALLAHRPEMLAAWVGLDVALLGRGSTLPVASRRTSAMGSPSASAARIAPRSARPAVRTSIRANRWRWRSPSRSSRITDRSTRAPTTFCARNSPTSRSSSCARGSASSSAPTCSDRSPGWSLRPTRSEPDTRHGSRSRVRRADDAESRWRAWGRGVRSVAALFISLLDTRDNRLYIMPHTATRTAR
jgi:hypothetical protein